MLNISLKKKIHNITWGCGPLEYYSQMLGAHFKT